MNFTTSVSDSPSGSLSGNFNDVGNNYELYSEDCQEEIFGLASAIEIQGVLSILSWVGPPIACILVFSIDSFISGYSWCRNICNNKFSIFTGIPGTLGLIAALVGILGNLILSSIIIGECGSDADYAFVSSFFFLTSLALIILGAIPLISLHFAQKNTAFNAVLFIFSMLVIATHVSGNINSFYQWSQYNKHN